MLRGDTQVHSRNPTVKMRQATGAKVKERLFLFFYFFKIKNLGALHMAHGTSVLGKCSFEREKVT